MQLKIPPEGGFFFRKCDSFFKSPKKIFQKTIPNLKFKFPAKNTLLLLAGNLNFKHRIVFWNIFDREDSPAVQGITLMMMRELSFLHKDRGP